MQANDSMVVLDTVPYGTTGAFAVNVWVKVNSLSGSQFEYIFSHNSTVPSSSSWGPNQVRPQATGKVMRPGACLAWRKQLACGQYQLQGHTILFAKVTENLVNLQPSGALGPHSTHLYTSCIRIASCSSFFLKARSCLCRSSCISRSLGTPRTASCAPLSRTPLTPTRASHPSPSWTLTARCAADLSHLSLQHTTCAICKSPSILIIPRYLIFPILWGTKDGSGRDLTKLQNGR